MKLDISDIETSAYQNFLDYIRNEKTRIKYSSDLKKFLDLVPDKIYKDNDIEFTDKTDTKICKYRSLISKDNLAPTSPPIKEPIAKNPA